MLTLTFLFSALAVGTTTVVSMEAVVAAKFKDGVEALYVADAGVALVVAELRELPDWTRCCRGPFVRVCREGPFLGSAAVSGGAVFLCCGGESVGARLARESAVDPVPGRRGLVWRPYLWSAWDGLVTQPQPGPLFLIVWVQDDEKKMGTRRRSTDLNGIVAVRAETVRPDGLRRVVEVPDRPRARRPGARRAGPDHYPSLA